ncbi:hypothetical protein [Sporomusa acidovorans]|uniref:Uncharacterized protein n=1 Tax=Sporomusa acidovorans (strain ATCC 49682 / DSM 3132 / Mol) TaxID=1123286 RepID=A0ABZ3J1V3_SPOA4|nr:hypothetical protein [Sporomusa acidovorans]OZC15040.1 hypothetical protein SPACI_51550 [Sporomusa acidovorans DSM 3132]SDE84509.1 hypothetical protein SAMN04488499_102374 [Sporomusa acidovorans]
MLNQSEELNNLQALMRLQNSHIQAINKLIYTATVDITLTNNHDFTEFVTHFFEFTHYHYNSDGYSQAAQLVQTYHYILLDRLLDSQVLAAAEQMESAISYLEMAAQEDKIRINPQIMLLIQGILLVEETQLKIIECLETILGNFRAIPQLHN